MEWMDHKALLSNKSDQGNVVVLPKLRSEKTKQSSQQDQIMLLGTWGSRTPT